MDDKLLTIRQAAEILAVSLDTLRRWDENGKLVAIRKEGGTHRYYRESDLEIFKSDLFKFAAEWAVNKSKQYIQFLLFTKLLKFHFNS